MSLLDHLRDLGQPRVPAPREGYDYVNVARWEDVAVETRDAHGTYNHVAVDRATGARYYYRTNEGEPPNE